jgi:hypothetical protein
MASFWQTIAVYCDHLAPVATPLLSSTSRAATALHNAECEARELQAHLQMYERVPALPPEDA